MPRAAGYFTPHSFGSTGVPDHFVWTSLVERSEPHGFARCKLTSVVVHTRVVQTGGSDKTNILGVHERE
jgi:hypothetical protein